jgi:hypothetical protein
MALLQCNSTALLLTSPSRLSTEDLTQILSRSLPIEVSLQQVASIRGAVNGLMQEILEEHVREYPGSETVQPEQRQQDLEQVLSILKSYLK